MKTKYYNILYLGNTQHKYMAIHHSLRADKKFMNTLILCIYKFIESEFTNTLVTKISNIMRNPKKFNFIEEFEDLGRLVRTSKTANIALKFMAGGVYTS